LRSFPSNLLLLLARDFTALVLIVPNLESYYSSILPCCNPFKWNPGRIGGEPVYLELGPSRRYFKAFKILGRLGPSFK